MKDQNKKPIPQLEKWWIRWERASERGDSFLANLAAQYIQVLEIEARKAEHESAIGKSRKEDA